MDINEFIEHFAEQFEETEPSEFTPETEFRNNGEWGSLLALCVMAMVDEEYDVQLTANEMRKANTIQELYNTVISHL